jgi:hypothetical protein
MKEVLLSEQERTKQTLLSGLSQLSLIAESVFMKNSAGHLFSLKFNLLEQSMTVFGQFLIKDQQVLNDLLILSEPAML